MNVYTFLIVPVIMGAILIYFFKHKVVWWELAIPIVYTIIFVAIAKWIAVESLTKDVEWLGGYVTEARYYEPWNERVSCRHPIYCTSCSGSGKSRSCRTYVCGHYHAYDVDYHPAHWVALTTLGEFGISEQKYKSLINQFQSPAKFTDLQRHYHTIDGDMYHTDWRKDDEGLEPVVIDEIYENKPRAALNVFHYDPLDTSEKRLYSPFEYPKIKNIYSQDCLLGLDDKDGHKALQVLNSRLGSLKQIKVFFLVFKDKPRQAAFVQERYWEGGNKNEFVICVGVNKTNEVQWAYDFSWTDKKAVIVDTRDLISRQKTLDVKKVASFLHDEIILKWQRKNFKDFDYLTIEPTIGQSITILILILLTNGLIGWWIVANEFENT